MEKITPRQSAIVGLARESGRVSVDVLADRFEVTSQTIRRDLNELCDHRVLQRVHGGAVLPSGVTNFGYEARNLLAPHEKHLIGLKAASLIPDSCSILINIGTTTEQVALALRNREGIMVITNNINVVNMLSHNTEIDVMVVGGLLRQADGGVVGQAAIDFISQFKVDYAVIGASAIDADGTLLDYDYREVKVTHAIIENARQTILVADHMKFNRTAPVRIGDLRQIDVFVTDKAPPRIFADACQAHDTRIELVSD